MSDAAKLLLAGIGLLLLWLADRAMRRADEQIVRWLNSRERRIGQLPIHKEKRR